MQFKRIATLCKLNVLRNTFFIIVIFYADALLINVQLFESVEESFMFGCHLSEKNQSFSISIYISIWVAVN